MKAARTLAFLLVLVSSVSPLLAFSPDRAGFAVEVKGQQSDHAVFGLFVLPGEEVPISVVGAAKGAARYEVTTELGSVMRRHPGTWLFTAPRNKGLVPLTVRELPSGRTMTLNAFVMIPPSHPLGGQVNGYELGHYKQPKSDKPGYQPPRGFVEVTAENASVRVSPHFTLGQFVCKQGGKSYPKYVYLQEKLLLALEAVLEGVNRRGFRADTFHVMSGYRTPAYNRSIGNDTSLSRHLYGDAADIFIDHDGDGQMDDLNRDGKSTYADAQVLGQLIEKILREPHASSFVGGLGLYHPNPAHGPFVHLDTRGSAARWSSGRAGG